MTYFELFNLPAAFEIDLAQLSSTYQTLQRVTHPDKFANSSEREKLLALQKNAQVNDAYTTLKSPLLRAEYMLNLRGIDLKHEQQTVKDTSFLMRQMEWREELEEIEHQSSPLDALDNLSEEIEAEIKKDISDIASLLNQQTESADLEVADDIRKLKFLYKMREEIERKEDSLSDF